jgi:hypothetical protein
MCFNCQKLKAVFVSASNPASRLWKPEAQINRWLPIVAFRPGKAPEIQRYMWSQNTTGRELWWASCQIYVTCHCKWSPNHFFIRTRSIPHKPYLHLSHEQSRVQGQEPLPPWLHPSPRVCLHPQTLQGLHPSTTGLYLGRRAVERC